MLKRPGRLPQRRLRACRGAVLALGLLAASCTGRVTAPGAHQSTPPTTSTPAATGATTGAKPEFPPLVVQAMAQFVPLPAGAEAPIRLPATSGYLTAQTGGLGGEANVTLIAATQSLPVNSPQLSSASAGREVASFSTTPTASGANASAALQQAKSQAIAACGGPSHPVTLADGTPATSCPTLDGAALDWVVAGWQVQVLTLSGTTPSTDEADHLSSVLRAGGLPAADGGGLVSVVVPGDASAGPSDTAALEWVAGPDVYQVRSSDDPTAAMAVATAMRPYPG
ncbi:MAG: hypothetical protein ACYDD6_09930 [Acidimicrobiales bacterium]